MAVAKAGNKPAFGNSLQRFNNLGVHPTLITTNTKNPLGPGQYDLKKLECCQKPKESIWKIKEDCEEFSKYLGFWNPCLLQERIFQASLGGPGTYDLVLDWKVNRGPGVKDNVGFGKQERFTTFIKYDQPPPGSHNVKEIRRKFTNTPYFEWDGFAPRFKSFEPAYKKAPNRYFLPEKSIVDKVVSQRGPYDCFTGPRDGTTIKNHFAPPSFKPPDKFFTVPSEMDKLLHHPSKNRCGKLLLAQRFPKKMTVKATKNGFTMYEKDPNFPSPAHYDLSKLEGIKIAGEALRPFNSSNKHARPPTNWKIHPGPDRYRTRKPKCGKLPKSSWMFVSKTERTLVKVSSYSNFKF